MKGGDSHEGGGIIGGLLILRGFKAGREVKVQATNCSSNNINACH
jgi:hypothetical protein